MGANIKINANSSDFQNQMKEMSRELKKVSSNYNLANVQAKLFGNTTDNLKAKQTELTSKINIQNNMVKTQSKYISDLNKDIDTQKKEQSNLSSKIEETTKKYKESVKETGKNSEESKKLKDELTELKQEYAKNNKEIESNIKKLDTAETKLNHSKKALLESKKELQDINKELEKSKLDKFSSSLESIEKNSNSLSKKMKSISTGIIGMGVASASSSIDFENGMAKVSTIADTTKVPIDNLKKTILDLSNQTGISSTEIANNVYDAISAGQDTADAVNFVSNSTKLAKSGFAEAGQALDILTTILNSYELKAEEVTNVSDTLIQTQNLGKVTVAELASSMGKVIPTAKSMGVNLTQVSTGYALMTSKGIKAAETTTYMNSMFNELGKSGTKANETLKKASGKTFQDLIKSGKSVGDILSIMDKYAKKNHKSLSDMFGSAEAGKAALILSGNAGKDFNNVLEKMKNSSGATEEAFKKVNSTTGQDLKTSFNELKNTLISFGDILSPFISKVSKGFSSIVKSINSMTTNQKNLIVVLGSAFIGFNLLLTVVSKLSKGLQSNIKFIKNTTSNLKDFIKNTKDGTNNLGKFINKVSNGSKNILSFGKTLLQNTASMTKNGIVWTMNTAKLIAYKTAQLGVTLATNTMTIAQKGLNFVLNMNPISKVITSLIALGTVFVTLYNKCDWFRNGVNAVWNGITNIFKGFSNFLKGIFKTDFTQTLGILGIPLNTFLGVVKTIFNGVKGVFDGLTKFLSGVFTGNWRTIFQGLRNIVSSIFGTIGGIIKAPINAAIKGINSAIKAVNKISFTVPDWIPVLGGKHFGINLPTIPALAEGGIVTKATMALVGEGKEHEAVIPLSKLDKLVTSSVEKVLNNNRSNSKSRQLPKNYSTNLESQIYEQNKLIDKLIDNFNQSRELIIKNYTYLDNKQIAKSNAKYMIDEINNINKRNKRLGGNLLNEF